LDLAGLVAVLFDAAALRDFDALFAFAFFFLPLNQPNMPASAFEAFNDVATQP